MKGIKVNLKKNNPGATLMMVVGTFAILLILMTAALSTATMAQRQTHMQYNKSQAYYIANSAVNTFIAGLENNDELNKAILGLTTGESFNSKKYKVKGAGEVEYNVKRDANDKIVVIAKAYYNNSNSQAAVILDGKLKNPKLPNFTAATVTLAQSNFANNFEATGDVIGKGLGEDPPDLFKLNNNVKVNGNVFVEGYLELNTGVEIEPGTNGNIFYVESTEKIYLTNNTSIICTIDSIPKAYVNTSLLEVDSGCQIGSATKNMNIYLHEFYVSNKTVDIFGDVHLYKKDGVAPSYTGENRYIHQGDLYIEGDYIHNNLTMLVDGDIYVTGTLTIDAELSANNIICEQLIVNSSQTTIGGKVYTPNTIGGTNGGAFSTKKEWNDAVDSAKLSMPRRPEMNDPEEVFAPYEITDEEFASYLDPDMFQDSNVIDVPNNGECIIDKSCRLTGDLNKSIVNITVKDEPIWICLEASFDSPEKVNITMSKTHPETPIFFYIPKGKTINFNKAQVMSDVTWEKINNGETFYSGNYANPSVEVTKGQPIYWFMDENSTLKVNDKSMFEGYVYAPFDTSNYSIDTNSSNGDVYVKISPDGLPVTGIGISPKLIGAIVVNKANLSNNSGVAFLTPNQSGIPGIGEGGAAADFKVEEFTRN